MHSGTHAHMHVCTPAHTCAGPCAPSSEVYAPVHLCLYAPMPTCLSAYLPICLYAYMPVCRAMRAPSSEAYAQSYQRVQCSGCDTGECMCMCACAQAVMQPVAIQARAHVHMCLIYSHARVHMHRLRCSGCDTGVCTAPMHVRLGSGDVYMCD